MRLRELCRRLKVQGQVTDAEIIGDGDPEIFTVVSDSRSKMESALFCCIVGERTDGHKYGFDAAQKGAAAILAERAIEGLTVPQLIVPSTREAMGLCASSVYGEPARRLKMYGVTGTNGKTTTSWIIRSILRTAGFKVGLIGTIVEDDGITSNDAERTTPESPRIQSLLHDMLNNGCFACVMETSSHGLSLGRLNGCCFNVLTFTNLTQEHLDFHKNMETYFEAKSKLFEHYARVRCRMIINADDHYGKRLLQRYYSRSIPFSIEGEVEAGFEARDPVCTFDHSEFDLYKDGKWRAHMKSPLLGLFNVRNVLAAIASVYEDVTLEALVKGVADIPQAPGRMECIQIPGGGTCIIDFAHTPEALRNILSTAKGFCVGRLHSVFGHGGGRYRNNRPLLGNTASQFADRIILTMDNPRDEDPMDIARQIASGIEGIKPEIILDRKEAIYKVLEEMRPGDVLVVSGKGPEKFLSIGTKRLPYNDAETVRAWVRGCRRNVD
jgi:UDP-N-acetylmuramoyl-L-alanyl-D-glutamate--2,6-diaminopimelate ligase